MDKENEETVEADATPAAIQPLDPFEAVYRGLAADALAEVLAKPHDRTTWRYLKKPAQRFRASEAGNCPRRIYYRLAGYMPAPDKADMKMKHIEGNVSQDVVRALFKQYDVPLEGIEFLPGGAQKETLDTQRNFEVTLPGETEPRTVRVSARADGRLPVTPEGCASFEFKTMPNYRVSWLQKAYEGKDPGTAGKGTEAALRRLHAKHLYYIGQVQITMEMFGDDLTYFGFKDKNEPAYGLKAADGQRMGLYIKYDPAAVQALLQQFAQVAKCLEEGEPPSLTVCPSQGSAECGFCPFRYQCHDAISRQQRGLEPAVVYPAEVPK